MRNTPRNEVETIIFFSEHITGSGVEILSAQSAFPDMTLLMNGVEIKAEFEYKSSHFIDHRHNPKECDLIVCWKNNLPKWFKFPVWELSTGNLNWVKFGEKEMEEFQYNTSKSRSPYKYKGRKFSGLKETGRPSIYETPVFRYMDTVYSETGKVPTFTDIMANVEGISKGTASKVRNKWIDHKKRQVIDSESNG